jgi:multiple sugar transport system permease protein/putative aldouronate transport system permease protein
VVIGREDLATAKLQNTVKVRFSLSDRIYYGIVYALILFLLILVLYPMIFILSSSFSSGAAVSTGRVILWPVDVGIGGYKKVFETSTVWIGYRNTIFYTVAGTAINIFMTMLVAYPLARKDLVGRKLIMFLFTFTMIFNGGMIPTYLLMSNLRLINTRSAMLLPGAINVMNMIITRTFIQSTIPDTLLDAAQIDGCDDFRYLTAVVLPLSKTIIAVIGLYYAVYHWNAYFNAFLYLTDPDLYPLQLYLREILLMNTMNTSQITDPELEEAMRGMADLIKYALIVVSTAPILCVYPFIQKYLIRGVMIGAIKG